MTEACEILAASDSSAVADVGVETQRAVEQFLYLQAEILDEKRMDEWMDACDVMPLCTHAHMLSHTQICTHA